MLEAAPAASPPLYARVDGIVGDDDSESARLDCLQTDQANEEGAAGQALR